MSQELYPNRLACEHHCLQPCTACKEGTFQRLQRECWGEDALQYTLAHTGAASAAIIARLEFTSHPCSVHDPNHWQPGISLRLQVLASTEQLLHLSASV